MGLSVSLVSISRAQLFLKLFGKSCKHIWVNLLKVQVRISRILVSDGHCNTSSPCFPPVVGILIACTWEKSGSSSIMPVVHGWPGWFGNCSTRVPSDGPGGGEEEVRGGVERWDEVLGCSSLCLQDCSICFLMSPGKASKTDWSTWIKRENRSLQLIWYYFSEDWDR